LKSAQWRLAYIFVPIGTIQYASVKELERG